MNSLTTEFTEYYRILGVSAGAGMADLTSSYKRLCRIHHPDVSSDPTSEEEMKRINLAYNTLRENLKREAALRDKPPLSRPPRRYAAGTEARARATDPAPQPAAQQRAATKDAHSRVSEIAKQSPKDLAEAERKARAVLRAYFEGLNACDYPAAYACLSFYDRRHITQDAFTAWRESVAKLYPMRGFKISGGHAETAVFPGSGGLFDARRYMVAVTEENPYGGVMEAGEVEKFVINENGAWRVFLGYMDVAGLTRGFEERYRVKRKSVMAAAWEEHYAGLDDDHNMLSLKGLKKAAAKEIYRQGRFGGSLTFAALSVRSETASITHEMIARTAAKTINAALREIDVPCYAGGGVFAVLFVGLSEENAEGIISRLVESIRTDAEAMPNRKVNIEHAFETWSGQGSADMDAIIGVFKKLRKKL
jgi:hypothetical protein